MTSTRTSPGPGSGMAMSTNSTGSPFFREITPRTVWLMGFNLALGRWLHSPAPPLPHRGSIVAGLGFRAMAALDALDDWPVAAAAAAVVGPSGVLASHGDTERQFALASVTKLLVARAAQIAIEEGAVDLDTAAGPPGSTVRHLLAHASGLAMHSNETLAKPGARRIYSNYGFGVLAETVERGSGIEFGRYLTEAVCEPLAMGTTSR